MQNHGLSFRDYRAYLARQLRSQRASSPWHVKMAGIKMPVKTLSGGYRHGFSGERMYAGTFQLQIALFGFKIWCSKPFEGVVTGNGLVSPTKSINWREERVFSELDVSDLTEVA